MKVEATYRSPYQPTSTGFVLVEVMVATFLAVLLVVPLASSMQNLVTMARDLRSDAVDLTKQHAEGGRSAAWTWGPRVASAVWSFGPELEIALTSLEEATGIIGVWAEGWKVGEWEQKGESQLTLSSAVWSELGGRELLIRAREPQGPWGPPWRTIVPDAWGVLPAEDAAAQGTETLGEWAGGEEATVVHVPSFCAPPLKASWTSSPVCGSALGLCFALSPSDAGWCELELGARRQSWFSADGLGLDVYF